MKVQHLEGGRILCRGLVMEKILAKRTMRKRERTKLVAESDPTLQKNMTDLCKKRACSGSAFKVLGYDTLFLFLLFSPPSSAFVLETFSFIDCTMTDRTRASRYRRHPLYTSPPEYYPSFLPQQIVVSEDLPPRATAPRGMGKVCSVAIL